MVEQSEYYPIYDYISNMYYKKYISDDMTYDEAKAVIDNLLDEILINVPDDYEIDTNYFYDYLNNYCSSIGISPNSITR